MKKLKKLLILVLCLAMVQVLPQSAVQPANVQAASKREGLVKSEKTGRYYFYEKGKLVKNKWKTVKSKNGKYYRYYFGSNGAAYAANDDLSKYNVIIKTIKGKVYGFDSYGHLAKGVYVAENGKFYVFNTKTGIYDVKRTKNYRNAAKFKANAAVLRKYLGKPKKTETTDSCFILGGKDVVLTYSRFIVSLCRYPNSTKEIVLGATPIMK